MIRNYVLVAFRNIRRHKVFSFINILGLAVSMSVCLGIIMLVADQLSYDRYNTKHDRIYRVVTRNLNPDGSSAGNDYSTSPQMLAQALTEDFTGVEKAVRFRRGFGNTWIDKEPEFDVNIPVAGLFADPDALDVFEWELEHGDAKTALVKPHSVVLTRKAANKLFKQPNPVGETIKVGRLGVYTVTGVMKEKNQKTHIAFEALASYATLKSLEADSIFSKTDNDYGSWTAGWVYLLLEKGHRAQEIEKNLAAIAKKHEGEKAATEAKNKFHFYLQSLTNITPGPFINNPIGPFMPNLFVYFFGGLAGIVMLTSCFNYTNLSIARSLTRAREIGVRKVNGANRFQIFSQFLSESVIIALCSLALGVMLLLVVKPFLLSLEFAQMLHWDLQGSASVYLVFVLFSLIVGLLAGIFPAAVLSKFKPVKVLKGAGSMRLFSKMGLRKTLLVGQFALSLIFILSVLVLYNQLNLFVRADHGFDMANKINVRVKGVAVQTLQAELSRYSNIQNVAAASHIPATGVTFSDGFKRSPLDTEDTSLDYFFVDANYLDNMNVALVAGRNFKTADGAANKHFLLINETAQRDLHFNTPADALGEVLYLNDDSIKFEIIGVVKDYNHQFMMSKIEGMTLRYDEEQYRVLQVKYSGNHDQAVKSIERAWTRANPGMKLDYKDFDEEVRFLYNFIFKDLVGVIGVIAFMAIFISCLGLLGMATYATETRLKEISIRKILGSTDQALVVLLSKSFLILLAIAVVIAVPAAWFLNNLWLQMIAYHTEFSFGVICSGVLILIVMGMLTVGSQTVRAAFANPVDNLKNE
ncbi:ABC transporter permease [Chryseolinea lacunae]|uniref:ABC transporter permease n=1 Tax=Chryseolinea lacunae TaxID=2801331 RepID=A0ABS1KRA6_9BACT|nr:ABC transporter permease [Chryseolinea lacunae]MBL0741782.1 ABC transporter permease [Chryseolinea lacunae]